MSRLDELIQELCPDGVPFIKMGECCTINKGQTPIQKAIPGEYPLVVTTDERKSSNTYQFEKPSVCIPLVSSRGHGVASLNQVYYQEGRFALGNILCAVTPRNADVLSAKFLYLYLNLKKDVLIVPLMRGGANVSLSMDSLEHIKIPIPPMAVQLEVVRILGKFTELITALTSELAARKKQYGFYRDKLLSFDTLIGGARSDIHWITLGKVASFRNGKGHERCISSDGKYIVVNSKFISTRGEVRKYSNEQLCPLFRDDILMVMSDLPNGRALAKCFLVDEDETYTLNQRIGAFHTLDESVITTKFLFYILDRNRQLLKYDNGVDQTNLKKDEILNIDVPIPSIEIQNRMVYVLDNFDAICSDLNIGLPAEIEARKKQYEFYRDKLLTFDIASATISGQTDRQTDRQTDGLIKLFQYVFGIAYVTLDSVIVSLNTGLNPRRFFALNTDDAENYYVTIRELQNNRVVFNEKTDRINDEALRLCNNRSNLEAGDVLFSGTGTIGEVALVESTPENWNIKEGVYTIKPNPQMLDSKYLMYLLRTKPIRSAFLQKSAGGTVKSVPMGEMRKLVIPLPSLDVQREKVAILDRFDALCNDISSGLPAEIEARQKQYEYYRDKLLTFEEKAV